MPCMPKYILNNKKETWPKLCSKSDVSSITYNSITTS